MKFKEVFGEANCKTIRERLEQLFEEEEGGFVIIFTASNKKVTDAYNNACKKCVLKIIRKAVNDADKHELLAESDENV